MSQADLPNFWQNLTFPVAQTEIFLISDVHIITVTFFLNIPHAHNYFLLGQEENGHSTISSIHISTVVHNSATMPPILTYNYCSMRSLEKHHETEIILKLKISQHHSMTFNFSADVEIKTVILSYGATWFHTQLPTF
jgi:hypothetical protein